MSGKRMEASLAHQGKHSLCSKPSSTFCLCHCQQKPVWSPTGAQQRGGDGQVAHCSLTTALDMTVHACTPPAKRASQLMFPGLVQDAARQQQTLSTEERESIQAPLLQEQAAAKEAFQQRSAEPTMSLSMVRALTPLQGLRGLPPQQAAFQQRSAQAAHVPSA